MVSEGFQRGLKPCGFRAEGSETVWFQRTGFQRGLFQRGLKPCGFRGVSEGSETVRSFRRVSEVSETVRRFRGVQRGLKPSVFIGRSTKKLRKSLGKRTEAKIRTSSYWERHCKK